MLQIVKTIMTKLQLGDEGKLGYFFDKQIKEANKAIRDLKRNKETLENSYKDKFEDLNDKLEDATVALDEAYTDVDPENLKTNADAANFQDEYWSNINSHQDNVVRIEKSIEKTKENLKADIERIDEQIAKYNERIVRIGKVVDGK